MKYKLHYAPLELDGDIPTFEAKSEFELNGFLLSEANTEDVVYLVSVDDEEFVCDHILKVIAFISINFQNGEKRNIENTNHNDTINVFVQEYASFEDAYDVALDMNEEHKLCYEK